ncbi:MAG: SurA N-terminal domain-containing protein [Bacteroidota bacterium]
MAVIGKIRSYSGLLIAVIGIALAAFVLGDFLGYGPQGGGQNLEVGEVGRSKIMYPEFERRVAEALENWRNQTGQSNPSPAETFQIRQQIWDQMVKEILLQREFEELGLVVTGEELTELVIGENPHPAILQSFTNPEDGSFDPQAVINVIQNLDDMDPNTKNQWFMLEDYIREQRRETKFQNLISKGFFVPEVLARTDYQNRNASAEVRLIARRFNSIDDSLVNISDQQLQDVYDEHKDEFKRDHSRDLEYVVFPIFPSEQDREQIRQEVENLKEELTNVENIENFININSDRRFNPNYLSRGQLSPQIDSIMFNAEEGTVYGPFTEDNAFVVAMLNDIQFRPDSMKASHILIAHRTSRSATPETTRTPEEASELADSLLNVVRTAPNRFAELATEFSEDPSAATNQGDLGWFPDGAMVAPFNEAVINTPVNNFTVAESEFGYHVIRVTGKSAATKKVQVALLVRNIEYSNQTFQRVFSEASAFSAALRENDDFDAVVEEQGLSKRIADNIRPMDNAIPGIENPRGIIQWAFAERTEEGTISQIFDLDGRFVVARVAEVKEEGVPALEDIREEIMEIALKEQKAEMIAEEFRNAQGTTLEEKAAALDLTVTTIPNITFNMTSLQGFGAEPAVIGSIFAIEPNTLSQPIEGNSGVFMVEVVSKNEAGDPENLATQQNQIESTFRNRVPGESVRALRESADITDNRYKFY